MQACTSIFKRILLFISLFTIVTVAVQSSAKAIDDNPSTPEDDILSGPFSGYGEFNSSDDETENERFFQYGRFFGLGIGAGVTTTSGNASRIYQGGFPTLDFRLLYWFDFNFALSLGLQNSKHSYNIDPDGLTTVNHFRMMSQVKYYFDTQDLSAPLSFIGPNLIVGVGLYRRTDNIGSGTGSTSTSGVIQEEQALGFNAGAGFELTIKPKRTYVDLEALMHIVGFNDRYDSKFAKSGITDKTGNWYSFSAILLFTW